MNWQHWQALRNDLDTMDPSRFDYRWAHDMKCGCVAVQVYLKHEKPLESRLRRLVRRPLEYTIIQTFLGVTQREAAFLYGYADFDRPSVLHLYGRRGIDEAISRLDFVAQRYAGQPDESAFLASCRSITSHPLIEVE